MPVRVQLSDGRTIRIDTDDPQEAARVARRIEDDERVRSSPAGRLSEQGQERVERQTRPILPELDEFNRQIAANVGAGDELAYGAQFAAQGLANLVRRGTGRQIEIPADVAGRIGAMRERERAQRFEQDRPIANVGAGLAGILASGRPQVGATIPRSSALATGGKFALANVPYALARQEGTLSERLPGAARETALVGSLGAGGQAISNLLPGAASRQAATNATKFARARVRPTLAAVSGRGAGALTKAISENPVGGNVRRALHRSIDDVQASAQRVAGQYGMAGGRELTGEAVQSGIERFSRGSAATRRMRVNPRTVSTRNWSFSDKARALYDELWSRVDQAEAAWLGTVRGTPIGVSKGTAARNPVTVDNARAVLDDVLGRVNQSRIAQIVDDPDMKRFMDAIRGNTQGIRFRDLRALRSYVRGIQGKPMLRLGIDDAGLQRLERALTEDIYASAQALDVLRAPPSAGASMAQRLAALPSNVGQAAAPGVPRAISSARNLEGDLRRIDQFYRTGQERINNALQPFADARNPAAAYERIVGLASERGQQNTRHLLSLKRSMRDDEWRNVGASIIDRMGRVRPGAVGATEDSAFSIANFVTNYASLSPQGKKILFGSLGGGSRATDDLADELDNLAQVGDLLKGVEQFANLSRSGSSAQNVATIAAAGSGALSAASGNLAPLAGLFSALGAIRLTGEFLTNPVFVRWLASAPRAGQTVGGVRRHVALLGKLAAQNPALQPLYYRLAEALAPALRAPGGDQPSQSRGRPAQTQMPPSINALEMQ